MFLDVFRNPKILQEETIKHFMECTEYGSFDDPLVLNDIFTQDTEIQFKIAENAKIRIMKRTMKLVAGLDSTSPGSQAPTFW